MSRRVKMWRMLVVSLVVAGALTGHARAQMGVGSLTLSLLLGSLGAAGIAVGAASGES